MRVPSTLGTLAAALAVVLTQSGGIAAQEVLRVRRGDIHITVHVHGTVITKNVITLTSTIPGRIEDVNFKSTGTWAVNSAPLGTVASARLAALLDSPTTTDRSVVIARWNPVFPMIPIECPNDCYLLQILTQPRTWISPGDALFTASQLLMTGAVAAGDAKLIHNGQWLTYWAKGDPNHTFKILVDNFTLEYPGQPESSGGSFSMNMTPKQYFPPGTAWEGTIVPVDHPDALLVPTVSLVSFEGKIFLPVEISTGITTADWTEIAAGVSEGEAYLLLNDAQLGRAVRHQIEKPAPLQAAPQGQQGQSTPAQTPADQEPDYGGNLYTQ